ncbi:MAG: hypothetical protein LBV00_12850 [Propionibacteriaceae bacterium]|jgi:hypothetical protein|nr:hypothetical protein [Propionibacteriaceae bacterium]
MTDVHDDRSTPMDDRTGGSGDPGPADRGDGSALAHRSDPALQVGATPLMVTPGPGGVQWVRASELVARLGMRVTDRGAVVRCLHGGMASITASSRRGVARRSAVGLPPVTVFGSPRPMSSVSRQGVSR